MDKLKVIGVSGFARAGKDTLAQAIASNLEAAGKKVIIKSLASPLKEMMNPFIGDNFDIDLFNCTDAEKELVRPLMVSFGRAKRVQSQGRFWTLKMDRELILAGQAGLDYVIIPDVRYAEYEFDEIDWLKSMKAALFHVKRIKDDGSMVEAPNDDEERNDPLLRAAADYEVKWNSMNFRECCEFVGPFVEAYLNDRRFTQN